MALKKVKKTTKGIQSVAVIALLLVLGALIIAIVDESSRTAYLDLAKVGLGGYIGLLMPRS